MAYAKRKRSFGKKKFVGKTRSRKTYASSNASFVKRVKRVMFKTCESKSKGTNHQKAELYHNQPASIMHLNDQTISVPSQGVGDNMRVGDQINISGYKIRMLIGQKADRPNVTFKYWVVAAPRGATYSYQAFFRNVTGNALLDQMNTDFVKILKSGTWKPHDGYMDNASDEYTFTKQFWVPRKKLLKFGPTDGSNFHNDTVDIYTIMVAYDAFGTLPTDNIAYVASFSDVFYRDP